MQTTTTRRPTDASRAGGRRTRRSTRRGAVLLAATMAALGLVAFALRGGEPMEMHGPSALLDPGIRGVYESDAGEQLTLLGTESRPYYEFGGRQVGLVPDGPGRFAVRDGSGERITLESDGTGTARALRLERPDRPPLEARRLSLYTEEEVTFASEGAVLSGTLLVPSGPGPHPAVVVVHGAEWATRETYRLQATHHARRGLAVLFFDKRGLGESTGDVASATFDDLTSDALAGVDMLRSHPRIDPGRIGVYGMSQGGWIVALAAQRSHDVAFVTTASPSGFSPADQNAWLYGNMLAVRGMGLRPIASADRFVRMLYSTNDLVEAGIMPPIPHVPGFWFHALDLHLDTAALWESVHQPVLAIWGADDCQVPAHDSAKALRDALERGGNHAYTLQVVADADHGLHFVGPCEHEIGMHHSSVTTAQEYFAGVAEWVDRLDDDKPSREYVVAAADETSPLGWHHTPPERAPWYGSAPAQAAAILVLLATFGSIAIRAGVCRLRRLAAPTAVDRLSAMTATTGLVATVVCLTALVELGFLGAVHAAQIVGDGPVAGMPPLFLAAGVLATAVFGLAVALAVRLGGTVGGGRPLPAGETGTAFLTLVSAALFVAWASYWQLPPFLPSLF